MSPTFTRPPSPVRPLPVQTILITGAIDGHGIIAVQPKPSSLPFFQSRRAYLGNGEGKVRE